MPTYRLGEAIARVYNPLPKASMDDVIADAGLRGLWQDRHGSAFALKFVWSQGPEREEVVINPGDSVELPMSIANYAFGELAGMGLVLLPKDPVTGEFPEEGDQLWYDKVFEALQKARQFYLMRGSIPLSKARVRHGVQDDKQWENVRIKFKGGLLNKAREDRVIEQIARLEREQHGGSEHSRTATSGKVKLPAASAG